MIKIKEAIIVEGRYDKEKLSKIVDTVIIETNGFRIFKDKEKSNYIKKLAIERGIIILTDSDSAGFLIRNHLKSFIDEKYIKNSYIPQITGKEKRKEKSSAEGFLGVEGLETQIILDAILKVNTTTENSYSEKSYTTKDLFNLGVTGKNNSKDIKKELLKELGLPSYLSNKDLLKYLNQNLEVANRVFKTLQE